MSFHLALTKECSAKNKAYVAFFHVMPFVVNSRPMDASFGKTNKEKICLEGERLLLKLFF